MFIYLVLLLPTGSSDLPETDGPPYVSFWSCFEWGLHMPHKLPCMRWSLKPPFHPYQHQTGGIFLLHYPWSRLHRTLSGILPCEARTFLTSSSVVTPLISREHLSYSIFTFLTESQMTLNQSTAHFSTT